MLDANAGSSKIELCSKCDYRLGVPAPSCGEPVELVGCPRCDRRHYIAKSDAVYSDLLCGVQAYRGFSPYRHLSAQRAQAIEELIGGLAAETTEDEQRQHSRLSVALPLVAVALDAEYRPLGDAIHAASVDISLGGLSFVIKGSQNASFWLADFGRAGMVGSQCVIQLVRAEPLNYGYWKMAGPLVASMATSGPPSRIIHSRRRM